MSNPIYIHQSILLVIHSPFQSTQTFFSFQGFVVCVLRTQPNDLVEFAAQYFAELLESRPSNNNDNCSMGITNDEHMDESMSDNDDYMDEAEGKCFSTAKISKNRIDVCISEH